MGYKSREHLLYTKPCHSVIEAGRQSTKTKKSTVSFHQWMNFAIDTQKGMKAMGNFLLRLPQIIMNHGHVSCTHT